nr:DUF348 domain-containing protein [Actinomycetales bacterium]
MTSSTQNTSFDEASQSAGTEQDVTATAPGRTRPRWFRPALAAAVLVPVLAIGGGVAAAAHKTIELDYDGDVSQVTTWSGSVAGFLEKEGIELAEHDEVAPGLDTALDEGSVVVIRVAQQVQLEVDGETTTIWTTAGSVQELMAFMSASGREASIMASSRSIIDGRDPLALPLVEDGDVLLAVDGREETRYFDGATSVRDALTEFGIELGEEDEVSLAAGPADEVLLKVTRISTSERTETAEVAFETETRTSASMFKDQSKVIQAGVAGERTIVYSVRTVDGEEVEVTEVSNELTTAPVTKIIEQGTKARPVAAPAASSSTSSSSSASSSSGGGGSVGGDVWARLAQCESGGNPSIVSASGKYHGLYQFTVATWQSVGGSGLPSQASASEQTQRAQALQARSGWGQWPACSSKLGLR